MTSFTATDELGEMEFESNLELGQEYKRWRVAHLVFAWILGTLATVAAAGTFLNEFSHWVILFSALVGGGLLFAYTFQISINEAVVQLGIKEKFAILLFMAALGLAPRLFGIRLGSASLLIFLLLFSLISYNALSYGKYYAVAIIIMCREILMGPFVPTALLFGFVICLIITFWLEYIAFRLQAHGKGRQISPLVLLYAMLPNLIISFALATAAYFTLWNYLMGKTEMPVFKPKLTPAGMEIGPQIYSGIYWDVVIIVVSIVGLILLMHWIEKKFRFTKKNTVITESPEGAAFEERYNPNHSQEAPLQEKAETDARARILQRFRLYAQSLTNFGWGRNESETPREYLERTAYHLLAYDRHLDPKIAQAYNKACYSQNPITDEEADLFIDLTGKTEHEITTELLRLKERAEYLDELKRTQQ
ncbi:MAG: DUF4129 domain-containing protein [Sumerlaeia bacterium]